MEVRLQQHPGGPCTTPDLHVVLVQHLAPQAAPEGLQNGLQDTTSEPKQEQPGNRGTHTGESSLTHRLITEQMIHSVILFISISQHIKV